MMRIVVGQSWKLNPTYREELGVARVRAPHASTTAIVDALGIEVDGVSVGQELHEAPVFDVVDRLASLVTRLYRDPLSGGQVCLGDGATELVLGRQGDRVSLCVVSLARPARIVAGEIDVDLVALAEATERCASGLLSDLSSIDPELLELPFARRLDRHRNALERAITRSCGGATRRPHRPPLSSRCSHPGTDAPSITFTLLDPTGRIDAYRKGGDLYALLARGEVVLRDAEGLPLAAAVAPPFLVFTNVTRAAKELLATHRARNPEWEGTLAPNIPRLHLDLGAGTLLVGDRTMPCGALPLARLFLQGTLDFGDAVLVRNRALAENPYLISLLEDARENLDHLQELEAGDRYADTACAPAPAARPASSAPLVAGTLKRLRFRVAWTGADTGSAAREVRLAQGALAVLAAQEGATFLDAWTGEPLARCPDSAAVFAEHGVLVAGGSRMLGFDGRGAVHFLRDSAAENESPLAASAGGVRAGNGLQPATVCLRKDGTLDAIFAATGRSAWRFRAPGAVHVTATALRDRVWVAADNGFVYALESRSGAVVLRVRTECAVQSALAVGQGVAAGVGSKGGMPYLVSIDAATGRRRRELALPLRVAGNPLPVRHRLFLGGQDESGTVILGFARGALAFRVPLESDAGLPEMTAGSGRLYAALRDGSVTCIGVDGSVLWRRPGSGDELDRPVAPILRRGVLIAAGDPIRAIDPETGAILCELPATRGLSALAVGPKLHVYAIDDDGLASCFQLATYLSVVPS